MDDGLGRRTYGYNNQSLLTTVNGPFGTERSKTYNIHVQPTMGVDANGVSVTQTFDRLGRLLTRAVPGQRTESFQYSARGLTRDTGPDRRTLQYGYDEAARNTSEVTSKNETISYATPPRPVDADRRPGQGHHLDLRHRRSCAHKAVSPPVLRQLGVQLRGQPAAGWRKFWSSPTQSQQTFYRSDAVGNLTNVAYPGGTPSITHGFDALNRLTNRLDGLGQTRYLYRAGQRLSHRHRRRPVGRGRGHRH